jgi:hypothetical protein
MHRTLLSRQPSFFGRPIERHTASTRIVLVMTGRSVTGRKAVMASPGPPCASQPGGSGRFQNKCEMKSIL